MHAVIDLHGRMSEAEASAKASGYYPLQERRHPEHKDTHLQIMGNQQHGRRSTVKLEGGQRWRRAPKSNFFFASASQAEINKLVSKNRSMKLCV